MHKVVRLDISLQKTAVCVLDHDGQVVWQGKVDSEPGPSSKGFGYGMIRSTWSASKPVHLRNGCTGTSLRPA
jgi:hypothetical protein